MSAGNLKFFWGKGDKKAIKVRGGERTKTMLVPRESEFRIPEVAAISNIGAREEQQDAFIIPTRDELAEYPGKGLFAAMADGMGGLSKGDEASGIAIGMSAEYFKSVGIQAKPHQALLHMAGQANKNIINYINYNSDDSGTTFIGAYVHAGRLWFVSIGDSRIYLYRAGKLLMLNREHVYARTLDTEFADGQISLKDADLDPQRQALTDFLGKTSARMYDFNIQPVKLLVGDGILLMSDGVFNTLSEEEIEAAIAGNTAKDGVARIQEEVLGKKRFGQDNFTCVYIKF